MSRKARTREYMELLNELDSHKKHWKDCNNSIDAITAQLDVEEDMAERNDLLSEREHWLKLANETENIIESIEARLECLYDDGIDVEEVARCREEGIVA